MLIFFFAFLREFVGHFILGLLLFSFFFFFGESSRILEVALLVAGADLWLFIQSVLYLYANYCLSIASIVTPMAIVLAVTLTISRLHDDHELLAFETLGINIVGRLKCILLIVAVLFVGAEFPLIHKFSPRARLNMRQFIFQGKNPLEKFTIEPKTWIDLSRIKLFAEEAKGNHLGNVAVYISEENAKNGKNSFFYKITARKASYSMVNPGSQERLLNLKLESGKMELPYPERPGEITTCYFGSYENFVPLDPPRAFRQGWEEYRTKDLVKLAAAPQSPAEIKVELASRWNFIFSPLALIFVSGYLALHLGRKSKGFGFGLALSLLAVYWIVMVLCSSIKVPLLTNFAYFSLGWVVYKLIPERV